MDKFKLTLHIGMLPNTITPHTKAIEALYTVLSSSSIGELLRAGEVINSVTPDYTTRNHLKNILIKIAREK